MIRGAVAKFRQLIDERGLTEAYQDSVGRNLAEIDHAVDRIDSHLKGAQFGWTARDADVSSNPR